MIKTERISEYELLIPKQSDMLIDATIFASEDIPVEESAIQQLADGASIPSVVKVVGTPDIHHGYGVPIGSVIATDGVIIPEAVGFDINCGMQLLTTNLKASEVDLEQLTNAIRRDIPLGQGQNNLKVKPPDLDSILNYGLGGEVKYSDNLAFDAFTSNPIYRYWTKFIEGNGKLSGRSDAISDEAKSRGKRQLATLGGGNHFIEFQAVDTIHVSCIGNKFSEDSPIISEEFGLHHYHSGEQLVIMIHSGSRGLGYQVGQDYMKIAKELNNDMVPYLKLDSNSGQEYLGAMNAAANYAYVNRHLMGLFVEKNIKHYYPDAEVELLYDVPHNIAKKEIHNGKELIVHRKGATRAFGPSRMEGTPFEHTGQPILIPGSMGTASYVLAGVDSNEKSLCSVNHGAGRVMSRTAAKGKIKKDGRVVREPLISNEDFDRAMEGIMVINNSGKRPIDEAPQAYKDIDAVIDTVVGAGLARLVAKLKPLAVMKG